jgi:hypothetical protein
MAKIVESFENIGETPNSPPAIFDDYADLGFLQPGYLSAYRFASGVRLLEPAPNDGEDNGEVLVGDFDRPTGPTWGLDGNGSVETADDVPDGSAYIGRNIEKNGTLAFGFDQPAFTVSAVVTAVTGELSARVGVAAYDANGQLITGARIASGRHAGMAGRRRLDDAGGKRRARALAEPHAEREERRLAELLDRFEVAGFGRDMADQAMVERRPDWRAQDSAPPPSRHSRRG